MDFGVSHYRTLVCHTTGIWRITSDFLQILARCIKCIFNSIFFFAVPVAKNIPIMIKDIYVEYQLVDNWLSFVIFCLFVVGETNMSAYLFSLKLNTTRKMHFHPQFSSLQPFAKPLASELSKVFRCTGFTFVDLHLSSPCYSVAMKLTLRTIKTGDYLH